MDKNPFNKYLESYAKSSVFKKRLIFWSATSTLLFVIYLVIDNFFHVGTEDAYINGNVVQIAPQVSGRIQQVLVTNNQFVKKDQPLFDLDPKPFQIALEKAEAQLALARQAVGEKNAAVAAATAQVAARQAEWSVAKSTADRTMVLVRRRILAQQTGDDVMATYRRASAALDAAKANLTQMQIALGKNNDDNEQVQLAKANVREAELNLSYAHVVAPVDGVIANLSLRAGTVVMINQPLFALIGNGDYWVDANLKETDLKNIKPGQKAVVEVDMYPHHSFQGVVDSVSGGSGTAFSLLPAQNATGNWVKVTQRVTVRVAILNPNARYPLRIGTSAAVKIRI